MLSVTSLPLPTHIKRDKESQLPTVAIDEWGEPTLQQRRHYLAFNEWGKPQHFSKGDTILHLMSGEKKNISAKETLS